jgi:hypothetical protein
VFRRLWTRSVGRQTSISAIEGKQWGSNRSRTAGGGRTIAENKTDTEGSNESLTATIAENRQVRPLLAIDEIVNRYSKHALNGPPLALVEVCGPGFFEVERTRYYQHEAFYRKFGKDPDFEFGDAPKPWALLECEQRERDYAERTSPAAIAAVRTEVRHLQHNNRLLRREVAAASWTACHQRHRDDCVHGRRRLDGGPASRGGLVCLPTVQAATGEVSPAIAHAHFAIGRASGAEVMIDATDDGFSGNALAGGAAGQRRT